MALEADIYFKLFGKIRKRDFVSMNVDRSLEEMLFGPDDMDCKLTEIKKNFKGFAPWLHRLRSDDFVLRTELLEKMEVACYLGQVFEFAPFASFPGNDEDIMVLLNFFLKQMLYIDTSEDNVFSNGVFLLKILNGSRALSLLFLRLKHTTNKEEVYDTFLVNVFVTVCTQRVISVAESYVVGMLQDFINTANCTSWRGPDIILSNFLQEKKEKNPTVYHVAVQVLEKCSKTLHFPIKRLLLEIFFEDHISMAARIVGHEVEVVFELHHICPSFLVSLWHELKNLKSLDSSKKKMALQLLAQMFTEKGSDFAVKHTFLWKLFKFCVSDSSSFGRLLLIKNTPKFLINQPDLCQDITDILEHISHDRRTEIRFGVVKAVYKATEFNFDVLQHSAIFDILKRMIYDKKEIVLKEALVTLGLIYRRITDHEYSSMMRQAEWIANTLMHLYVASCDVNIYITHIEKVIGKYLVPCELPPDQRMKKLLLLWSLFDDKSRSNFHYFQELKKRAYEAVLQLLSLYQGPSADEKQLVWKREMLAGKIAVTMGGQKEVHGRLLLLTKELAENRKMLNFLQEYVNNSNSITKCALLWSRNRDIIEYTSQKERRSPTSKRKDMKQDSIALTVRNVCAKVACFMVDKAALKELLKLVINCVSSSNIAEDLHLAGSMTGNLAVNLLYEHLYLLPRLAFQDNSIMDQLLFVLKEQNYEYSLPALKIFVTLSAYKPLSEVMPAFVSHQLVPLWQHLATSGTPAQVKLAISCLCSHITDPVITYNILTECVKELDTDSEHYLTTAVAVGQFATHLPNYADKRCIAYVAKMCHKLIQKLIVEDFEDERDDGNEWREMESLPYKTKCRIMAVKALARLTVKLRAPIVTECTVAFLSKIIQNGGAYRSTNSLSTATKAWLRLTAGRSFLKICDVPCIFSIQVRKIYFFKMATLMIDESEFVRRMFVEKLRERLIQWKQERYGLSSTFISYFVLAGLEQNDDVKSFMLRALNLCVQDKRWQMWRLVHVMRSFQSTSHLLARCQQTVPEFCVQTALQIVARFVFDFADETSVCRACLCLTLLFNSLLGSKNGTYGLLATVFHLKLFSLVRCSKNAVNPEDEELNKKIWATCEIGEYLLSTFDPKVNNNAVAPDPLIDERFYKIVPGIDNRSIKYLTANIETLLRERGSPELLAMLFTNKRKHGIRWQDFCSTESPQETFDNEAHQDENATAGKRKRGSTLSKKNQEDE